MEINTDVIPLIASCLDPQSAINLVNTCKAYSNLKTTALQRSCSNLSEDEHMDWLIYFSQRGNGQKVSYIIENENETNRKNRSSILYEFGYIDLLCDGNDIHPLNRENNMRAYKAMRKEDDVPNMNYFYSKAYVGSTLLIKVFSRNVDLTSVTFGNHILFWPTLTGDGKFAKFLLDSGMNFDNETLHGLLSVAQK